MGVLVERAISNLNKEMTIEENRDDLENAKHDAKAWFLVDDLNYLKRGGRVSAATAFLGSMLNVKPLLRILPNYQFEALFAYHQIIMLSVVFLKNPISFSLFCSFELINYFLHQ